jgi:hypothetical protein
MSKARNDLLSEKVGSKGIIAPALPCRQKGKSDHRYELFALEALKGRLSLQTFHTCFDHAGGNACHHDIRWHGFDDDGAGADHSFRSNGKMIADDGAHADVGSLANLQRAGQVGAGPQSAKGMDVIIMSYQATAINDNMRADGRVG